MPFLRRLSGKQAVTSPMFAQKCYRVVTNPVHTKPINGFMCSFLCAGKRKSEGKEDSNKKEGEKKTEKKEEKKEKEMLSLEKIKVLL